MIEFILVGIGILFGLFSIFELARGMWIYTTLAHAIKAGTRYAVVHGTGCVTSPNNCPVTVGSVAAQIKKAAVGLDPASITVTAMSTTNGNGTYGPSSASLSTLQTNTNYFPVDSITNPTHGMPGDMVTISATYPFNTFISMFWPGSGKVGPFGLINLPAIGQQQVEF